MRYYFEDFELDVANQELRRAGQPVHLYPGPLRVLAYLIKHRDRAVSKEELIREVWRLNALSPSAVPTAVGAIRQALDDDSKQARIIATLSRSSGYRFVSSVRLEIPSLPGSLVASPLFGRASELKTLEAAFDRCVLGKPGLVLVAGEPGIGKTRLAEEFARAAGDRGAEVLVGRCLEGDGASPFWPWVQVLRTYTDRRSADALSTELGPHAAVLAQMVPELELQGISRLPHPTRLDPRRERLRLFDAISRFLSSAASKVPIVALIDDLHQADVASLSLLEFLGRELQNTRMLLVCTYRDQELEVDQTRRKSIARLARLAQCRTLVLDRLTLEDVCAITLHRLPDHADLNHLAAELHHLSGGNAFFLTQLLDLFETRGAIELSPNALLSGVPEAVRQAIALQIETLPEATASALDLATVLGRDVDLALLASALGKSVEATLQVLFPALRARLLMEISDRPGQLRFSHILLRTVLYESIPAARRSVLHREVGRAIEQRWHQAIGTHSSELVYHFRQARDHEGTIRHALYAAKWATDRLAYEEAPSYYRVALEAMDDSGGSNATLRSETLLALGDAQMRAGDRDEARLTLRESARIARSIGRADLVARSALSLAPGFFALEVGVVDHSLIASLEEALALLGDEHADLRAQILARLALALVYSDEGERSRRLSSEALRLAEDCQPGTLAYVLTARYPLLAGPEHTRERISCATDVITAALRSDDRESALVHRLFRLTDLLEIGNVNAVDQEIDAFSHLAAEVDLPQARWYSVLFQAMRKHLSGNLAEVERLIKDVVELGQEVGDRNSILSSTALMGLVRAEQSRFSELVPVLEAVRAQFPAIDLPWRCATAWGLSQSGPMDLAESYLASVQIEKLPKDILWLSSLTTLAIAAAGLGDEERAASLYRELEPFEDRTAVVGFSVACLGAIARPLGLLAEALRRWDAAERHLENALRINERLDSPLWVAHTQYDLGHMLVQRGASGDRERAIDLAQRASGVASRLGLTSLARKSHNLLVRLS